MALSQQRKYQQQRLNHNNNNITKNSNRTKGPAPQSYVFADISNYEENEVDTNIEVQQENLQNNNNNNNPADDTDFNSSCCDYQSDVFKEQPSQYIDDSASKYQNGNNNGIDNQQFQATIPGILSLHECGSDSDFKENLMLSGSGRGEGCGDSAYKGSQGCYVVLSPNSSCGGNNNGFYSNKQTVASMQQQQPQMESQQSLRVNVQSVQESLKKDYNSANGNNKRVVQYNCNVSSNGGVRHTSKNSCDHSLITPNYRTQHNGTSTTNKNSKTPLYTMVPSAINKNLNKNVFSKDEKAQQQQCQEQDVDITVQNQNHVAHFHQPPKSVIYTYNTNNANLRSVVPLSDESADCIMSGQLTIQKDNNCNQQNQHPHLQLHSNNGNSFQNLTPQKYQPTPMSPLMKPILSNCHSRSGIASQQVSSNGRHQLQQPQLQPPQYDSRNFLNQMPQSTKTQNSGQKATVVYNEFKYYTSGVDIQQQQQQQNAVSNTKKFINIGNSTIGQQQQQMRKSDISASHISGQQPLIQVQYELSPSNNQNIFDNSNNLMASPKQSMSNGQASFNNTNTNTNNNGGSGVAQIRANSIRQQILFNSDRQHLNQQQQSLNIIPQNYQIQLKQQQLQDQDEQLQPTIQLINDNDLNQQAQSKILQLQNYIEQLETDLQASQNKNLELKKKFKEKSFLQSFERNSNYKKHLSDTEDSLILSEKKNYNGNGNKKSGSILNSQNQRNSLTSKVNNNSSLVQLQNQQSFTVGQNMSNNQNTNTHSGASEVQMGQQQQQKSSSIVDVKIRPIMNLKNMQINTQEQQQQQQMLQRNNSNSFIRNQEQQQQQQQLKRSNIDQESDNNILEYQVQDYNDYSNSQLNQSNDNNQQQQLDDSQSNNNNHQHISEDECEGCERLKQLVFQAKEAIDDLKLEIEEWRDICSDKETELRQLQHKIYNDIMGVDKKIEFNEEIQTKEFDASRPVMSADQRKVRNFIQHNKKRIRSRSKTTKNTLITADNNNTNINNSNNVQGRLGNVNVAQSLRKKSALKSVRDLVVSEDFEFYEAEDIGLQTSFDNQMHINSNNNNEKVKQSQQQQQTVQTHELQTNESMDSSSTHRNHHNNIFINSVTSNNNNQQQTDQDQQQLSQHLNQQQLEELCSLRTKNQLQEQEMNKMRQQIGLLTGQIDKFMGLMTKIKKRNNQKNKQQQSHIDLEEIQQNYEIISNIESYSILEKINEWKRIEGLLDQNTDAAVDQDPLPTQIPRPLKLIQDIDLSEIELYNFTTLHNKKQELNTNINNLQQQFNSNNTNYHSNNNTNNMNSSVINHQQQQQKPQHQQYDNTNNSAQEFLQMIKIEQENLKRQTDQKYKELQKQQQDYLNVLKGV